MKSFRRAIRAQFATVGGWREVNEHHERHLLTTFRHIDNLLAEAEGIVATAGAGSPFAEYAQDSTPVQRKVLHDYVERVRQTMTRAMSELGLPQPAPCCGAMWGASGRLTFTSIAVAEIEPQRMKGYGALSEQDAKAIREVVAELNATLERLIAYWNQGPDADLQARLARLEKTTGETRLLTELQRVVTSHGLVEFRGNLEMLLERLEEQVFEIGVFGRVSSGKSSLLNYVLGSAVLPVGVTPVTSFPTRLRYGAEAKATVGFVERKAQEIELSRLAEFVTEQQNPGNAKHVMRIEAGVPARHLREGVTFVDTPGLGSLATAGSEETIAYLPRCDLGVVLVDGGSTVTYEDLAIVQALYQAGARVMVLLSKADVLAPAEVRELVDYVERQLEKEAGARLKVYALSVVDGSAAWCEDWLRTELMPLVEAHRQESAVALKRKVGALREAVIRVLERRLRGGERRPGSAGEELEAVRLLRKAAACLEEAGRKGERILDGVWSLSKEVLDVIAGELVAHWRSAGFDGRQMVAAGITQALMGRVVALAEILSSARLDLADRLSMADKAAGGTGENADVLPHARGAPIPDVMPVVAGVTLKRSPIISKLGDGLTRRHFRRQLERQVEPALSELWNGYRRLLREWFDNSRRELQEAFTARAGIYRLQFEGRALGPGTGSGQVDAEADLAALRKL